nr:PREDICTED: carboxypeptidase N subunit 2-like [Megachile rotundata]
MKRNEFVRNSTNRKLMKKLKGIPPDDYGVRCQNEEAEVSDPVLLTSEVGKPVTAGTIEISDPVQPISEVTIAPKLPSLCAICNCTGDTMDCSNRNLTDQWADAQWPNVSINVVTFEGNSLVNLTSFPKAVIHKLILKNSNITKISNSAFKQLINLTELDLSGNHITRENLQPSVFEGRFSVDDYEPLAKLTVLNLASNELHSLHQDIFEHTPALKILNLSKNLFSKIDHPTSIALSSLPQLEELDLSYCSLTMLPESLFYTSRTIKRLNLSGNRFMVPPPALEEATTLEYLYMDENPLQILNQHQPFPTLPKLKELSLCCMPYLTVIGKGAFSGLKVLEHLRIQNCPNLESIDEYALSNETESGGSVWPPLKKLDLSDNALRYLPAHFVARWDWLEELDLMNNKWSCDCNNQYLIHILLPQHGKKLMGENVDMLKCAAPPEHLGRDLLSLSNRTVRCLDLNGAQPEKDATILIGMFIGVMLAIPVCLVIFILWRRGFFFCGPTGPASFSRAFYTRTSNDDDVA